MEAGAGPVRQSPMQSPFAGTSRFGLLDADAAGTFLAADVFTVTVAARTLPYRYDSAVSYDGDAPYAAGIAAGEQAAGGSEPLPSLPVLAAPAAAAAAARHSTSSLSAAATCGGSLDPSWASSQPRCHRLPALRSSQLGAVALASSPSAASRGPGPSAETDEAQSGPRLPGPESLRSLSSYANLSAASSSATVGRTAAAFGRSRSTPFGLVLPPSERSQDPPAASSTSATASPKAQPASPRPPPRPPALVISSRASSSHVFPHVDHPIPATDAPRRGPARSASPSHQSPALAPSLQSPPSSLLPPAAAGGRVKPAWLEAKATEEQEYDEEPQGGGYLTPPLPGIRTPASPRSPVPPLSLGLLGPRQDRWATATPHSQPHSPRSPSTAPPLFPREGRRAEPDAEPSPAASLLGLGPGPGPGPGRLGQGLGRCASQELGGCVPPRPRLLAPIRRAATRLCVQSPDPHEQSASSSGAPRPAEPGAWTRPALPEGWSDATPLSLGQEEELGAA
ncbi:hypothetical protein HYH03_011125 [Edaphochlamys debaryana]|uniref:Uncharacterized protein n=1 Tax=Edaphochlamys debaryana TaxID=47281 RepID=A0A835XUK0_9CHLO|nr:hypothetical protein HYH03_011125 [Edaphochlamys debaryana]|eukprot:KAG2490503.1 hypothetical protein HYH03_011125 [Edaphochlamys debaryana]